MDRKAKKLAEALKSARDVWLTLAVSAIIIGGIVLYTQNWPPLVVIESGSMRHSAESQIGVIDAGDMVFVKRIKDRHDVITYVEGEKTGYMRYGDYGDVIIYRKNGHRDITPVIHRAIVWVEVNRTTGNFDVPDMGLYNVTEVEIVGLRQNVVKINLSAVPKNDGFITMGDHNSMYDQAGWMTDGHGNKVGPVAPEWVVGKAVGEIPWFGGIKLYLTDENPRDGYGKEAVPENSWRSLKLAILLIIIVPLALDILVYVWSTVKKHKEETAAEENSGQEEHEGVESQQQKEK